MFKAELSQTVSNIKLLKLTTKIKLNTKSSILTHFIPPSTILLLFVESFTKMFFL